MQGSPGSKNHPGDLAVSIGTHLEWEKGGRGGLSVGRQPDGLGVFESAPRDIVAVEIGSTLSRAHLKLRRAGLAQGSTPDPVRATDGRSSRRTTHTSQHESKQPPPSAEGRE